MTPHPPPSLTLWRGPLPMGEGIATRSKTLSYQERVASEQSDKAG